LFQCSLLSDATKVHTCIKDNCDLLIGWFYARGPLGIIYVRKSPEFRLRFFDFWPPFWYYFPLCGAIIVLFRSQSARVVLRKCLHSMRCALENRNALLRRGISADCLAPHRIENNWGLRKTCTRRKRHLELATARRTRCAVVVPCF
jgi:hypothetical protein